jgi:hypothetical protein
MLPEEAMIFKVVVQGQHKGWFALCIYGQLGVCHMQIITDLSHNDIKRLTGSFEVEIIEMCKRDNIQHLVTHRLDLDDRWGKFLNLFGFTDPIMIYTSTRSI